MYRFSAQGRDIKSIAGSKGLEIQLPVLITLTKLHHIVQRLFGLADIEGVDIFAERFGIHGAGAAGNDHGMSGIPVRGPQRNSGQIEGCQDVGVGQFVLKGDADYIEVPERMS